MTEEPRALPTVAVVVPTAGRRRHDLLRSLESILHDPATTEVAVAAAAPADEPLPEVPRDPRVRTVRVPRGTDDSDERGERAREWAVSCATSEVVLALDDDVVAEPGLVTRHASRHRSRGIVVVGYMPVAQSGLALRWRPAGRYYSRSYEATCSRYEMRLGEILKSLWGGNLSIRRSDWLRARDVDGIRGGY